MMRAADELAQFVRDALLGGRSRTEIDGALDSAGWSSKERDSALNAYAEVEFTPPIPRPRPFVSAKDAFIYGLLFVAMAAAAISLNNLMIAFINLGFPTENSYSNRAAYTMIRLSIAVLVVAVPIFIWLTYYATNKIRNGGEGCRSVVRKLFTYLALFITAIIVAGDIITLLYFLMSGDATTRFMLKALSVGVIFGTVFLYYLKDAASDE